MGLVDSGALGGLVVSIAQVGIGLNGHGWLLLGAGLAPDRSSPIGWRPSRATIGLPCPAGDDGAFRWREMSGVALGGEDALAVVNPIAAAPPIRYEVAIAQLGS